MSFFKNIKKCLKRTFASVKGDKQIKNQKAPPATNEEAPVKTEPSPINLEENKVTSPPAFEYMGFRFSSWARPEEIAKAIRAQDKLLDRLMDEGRRTAAAIISSPWDRDKNRWLNLHGPQSEKYWGPRDMNFSSSTTIWYNLFINCLMTISWFICWDLHWTYSHCKF